MPFSKSGATTVKEVPFERDAISNLELVCPLDAFLNGGVISIGGHVNEIMKLQVRGPIRWTLLSQNFFLPRTCKRRVCMPLPRFTRSDHPILKNKSVFLNIQNRSGQFKERVVSCQVYGLPESSRDVMETLEEFLIWSVKDTIWKTYSNSCRFWPKDLFLTTHQPHSAK